MYKKELFKGKHLNGDALLRSQDFTKNTLDIKSSTGIGATTSILNITTHDVLAVFPLRGVIEAKEQKRHTFKSKRQYFIYAGSRDKWTDIMDYFDSYGYNATNVIICTTAEQVLKVRNEHPELYLKLITKPLFIDEIHLFTQEWRLSLATFINVVRNEWQNKYKLSTATPIRNFNEIFGSDFDICTLQRENEPTKKLLKTDTEKEAWKYVFAEMEQGRNVVIFSNDIRHHKKEFMEETRINLTGDGLKYKLSAFGKGLDHFSEKQIDTTFLDKFPLIFCSSKYLTGYDIEPTSDTSILILTNNKDQSTSYSVEDIIQAYGRVRRNLVNALVCVVKAKKVSDQIELNHLKTSAAEIYNLTKLTEYTTPKNQRFNKKSYNKFPFDLNGYASKLLAYDSYLNAESDYIMYNTFDAFMIDYGFNVEPLKLTLSNDDLFHIAEIQKTKKKLLKCINIERQINNIIAGQKDKNIYNTIINLSLNPKTKRNRSGYSCELITMYCIAFFTEYLPPEIFQKIKYKEQKRLRELSNQLIIYFDTNYPDKNLRKETRTLIEYQNSMLLDYPFEPSIHPDHLNEIIRIFRYANHYLNMNFDSLGDESRKTIEMFYLINKYKLIYQKPSRIKNEIVEHLKGYELNEKDMIRIDKNIAAKSPVYKMERKAFIKMNVEQIRDASMYLMSRNQSFISSYIDGREYNPLTQISTVFRENFLYNYTSIDIVSANAQFTDKIIGSKIGLNVYQNLMNTTNKSRNEAKVIYNSTLNDCKRSVSSAYDTYLKAGYSDAEAYKLANLTAGTAKGSYFKLMAKAEEQIINAYNDKFCSFSNALRLHDSLILENIDYPFPDEYRGVKFKIDIF
jgi:hypothetical protein